MFPGRLVVQGQVLIVTTTAAMLVFTWTQTPFPTEAISTHNLD